MVAKDRYFVRIFEAEKALEVGMRDNSLPLLEAIVQNRVPTILQPKYASLSLLNLP